MNEPLTTQLIRRYVDGELDDRQLEELERALTSDPRIRAVVEFETRLREHVGTAMSRESVPEGLGTRIEASLHEQFDPVVEVPLPAGRVDEFGGRPVEGRKSWWRGTPRANLLAVAATLVLVAGAILVSIFSPQIDDWQNSPTLTDVAAHVSVEHARCATDATARGSKAAITDRQRAARELAEHLGMGGEIRLFDLSGTARGYQFVGAGPCKVPGSPKSAHLLYRLKGAPAGDMAPMVSVFIEPDEGQFGSCCQACDPWKCLPLTSECTKQVMYASDGQMLYFVVCCMEGDVAPVSEALRAQLRVPPARQVIGRSHTEQAGFAAKQGQSGAFSALGTAGDPSAY